MSEVAALVKRVTAYEKNPGVVNLRDVENLTKAVRPDIFRSSVSAPQIFPLLAIGGEGILIRIKYFPDASPARSSVIKVIRPELHYAQKTVIEKRKLWNRTKTENRDETVVQRVMLGAKLQAEIHDHLLTQGIDYFYVPQVHRICEAPSFDWPSIEMEFIEGINLFRYCVQQNAIDKTIIIFRQVLTSMALLQELNVIHRDIKPTNFHITGKSMNKPVVALLDWSNAKRQGEQRGGLTQSGYVVHTPKFSSLRVTQGEFGNAGIFDEIYSLGVVLWCLVTQEPIPPDAPYGVRQRVELESEARQIYHETLARSLPAPLDQVFLRATNVDMCERYQSYLQFRDDIDVAAQRLGIDIYNWSKLMVDDILTVGDIDTVPWEQWRYGTLVKNLIAGIQKLNKTERQRL